MRSGEGDRQNRVRPQPRLVRSAVQLAQGSIERLMVGGIPTGKRDADLGVDRLDCLADAAPSIALRIAVATLDCFVRAGAGSGRHGGAAKAAADETDIRFNGRISSGIENLAGANLGNSRIGHRPLRVRDPVRPCSYRGQLARGCARS